MNLSRNPSGHWHCSDVCRVTISYAKHTILEMHSVILLLSSREKKTSIYHINIRIISYRINTSYHIINTIIYILHHLCDPERVMFRLQNQAFQASPKGHSDHAKVTRKDAAATAMETFR